MIRTWSVLAVAGLFAVLSAVPLAAMMHADEPTPAAVAGERVAADSVTLPGEHKLFWRLRSS